jgi:hypothetical protein
MAFDDMLIRRLNGPNTDEVAGELRNLNNEELYNLY